ncbi:MAG: hypothetical protein LBT86_07210 [Deltaproteobacteria bacterium]|nr:hypothetical protein [Deltaproteobacteria bacterium]
MWKSAHVTAEPKVTFPQANSFPRVLDLLSVLYDDELTRSDVTLKYEFDPRQTSYYVSACDYLGFIELFKTPDNERGYRLTAEARRIMSLPYKKKYLALIQKILEKPVFHKAFEIYARTNFLPDKKIISQIMRQAEFSKPINETTIDRRASTARGWLEWTLQLAAE